MDWEKRGSVIVNPYREVLYWCVDCGRAVLGNEVYPVGCPLIMKINRGNGDVEEYECNARLYRVIAPYAEATWRIGGDNALLNLLFTEGYSKLLEDFSL
jgi:hypothetical protein